MMIPGRNFPTGDDADQGIPLAPACWRCGQHADDWVRVCGACWEANHAPRPTLPAQFLVAVALLLVVAFAVAMGMVWR